MPENDIRIFDKIRRGDLKAYEMFFKAHYAEIVRYAYKFVRDGVVAEEIAQEVFMYLWEKRAAINIQSSLLSYLYSATKNRSINYLRLELPKIQSQIDINEASVGFSTENKDPNRLETIERLVKNAIDDLPKKCREIFILSRNAGLTYDEISEELGISKKTVENQMGIALKKLRVSLKPVIDYVKAS